MKTLYYNGKIITVNDAQPQAEALLVEDGKIIAVGTQNTVSVLKDDATELVDLQGKTMTAHFKNLAGQVKNETVQRSYWKSDCSIAQTVPATSWYRGQ